MHYHGHEDYRPFSARLYRGRMIPSADKYHEG
jgi:hypothetical protein